jgi:ketosteroid isomerase-like protein
LHILSLSENSFRRNLFSSIRFEDFDSMIKIEEILNSEDAGKIIEIYTENSIFLQLNSLLRFGKRDIFHLSAHLISNKIS